MRRSGRRRVKSLATSLAPVGPESLGEVNFILVTLAYPNVNCVVEAVRVGIHFRLGGT
jgi:hypothetical protein